MLDFSWSSTVLIGAWLFRVRYHTPRCFGRNCQDNCFFLQKLHCSISFQVKVFMKIAQPLWVVEGVTSHIGPTLSAIEGETPRPENSTAHLGCVRETWWPPTSGSHLRPPKGRLLDRRTRWHSWVVFVKPFTGKTIIFSFKNYTILFPHNSYVGLSSWDVLASHLGLTLSASEGGTHGPEDMMAQLGCLREDLH